MRVRLDYGKTGLEVELPDENLVGVLGLNPAPALPDPVRATAAALANPIGTRGLAEIVRGKRNACIVVCDITRPVPNPILLPPILHALELGGVKRTCVTILIATGTHRPNFGDELNAILGPDVTGSCRVVNHVCRDSSALVDLGMSPFGVPVKLSRAYVDADLRITVGLIEPHFMAGYSGGRKLVMPGIAALETVQAWHSPRFLEHPNATAGIVAGNPVHEESLAIAKMARPDMIVDVTLDERNRITGIFAGDLEDAWLAGVAHAEEAVRAPIEKAVDVVVTSSAGYPLDATFYQAVKGMVGALPIVKPGGSIIIAASCSEGIGSDHFTRTLLETDDLEQFTRDIQRPDWSFIPDQWEVEELARAARSNRIHCVCDGIPHETLAQLFVTPASTIEEAVSSALESHGSHATIAAIPKGPYVIPYIVS